MMTTTVSLTDWVPNERSFSSKRPTRSSNSAKAAWYATLRLESFERLMIPWPAVTLRLCRTSSKSRMFQFIERLTSGEPSGQALWRTVGGVPVCSDRVVFCTTRGKRTPLNATARTQGLGGGGAEGEVDGDEEGLTGRGEEEAEGTIVLEGDATSDGDGAIPSRSVSKFCSFCIAVSTVHSSAEQEGEQVDTSTEGDTNPAAERS
jgi:hypothetical protein